MTKPLNRTLFAGVMTASMMFFGCWEHGHHHHHNPTAPPDVIIGSGRLTQEQRPIAGVYGVRLVGIGDIEIRQGASENLVVQAEDNLIEFIKTEVIGGILVISQDPDVSIQATRRIVYSLDVTNLESAEVVGTGNVDCDGLDGNRLEIRSIGVGSIDFSDLSLNELVVTQAGVGNVRTTGTTDTQRVTLTGVGTYEGKSLDSAVAYVDLLSVGSATVRVRDRLVANVNGPGCLYYVGNPTLEASGVGCIRQIN